MTDRPATPGYATPEQLRGFIAGIYRAVGVPAGDAAIVAGLMAQGG